MKKAAALIACSLFWLLSPVSEAAAVSPSSAKRPPAVQKKVPVRPVRGQQTSGMAGEVLVAEVDEDDDFGLRGHASFYGHGFQGRRTSTGERFDVRSFTAASNRFPLGSKVAVRRLDSDRCAIVVINDRMHDRHRKRIIDVSRGVAEYLDMIRAGVVLVKVAPVRAGAAERGNAACRAAFDQDGTPVTPLAPFRMPSFDWPIDSDSAAP